MKWKSLAGTLSRCHSVRHNMLRSSPGFQTRWHYQVYLPARRSPTFSYRTLQRIGWSEDPGVPESLGAHSTHIWPIHHMRSTGCLLVPFCAPDRNLSFVDMQHSTWTWSISPGPQIDQESQWLHYLVLYRTYRNSTHSRFRTRVKFC